MELAEKMLGLEGLAEMRGKVGQQAGLRRRQMEHHRLRVDDLDCHWLAANQSVFLRLLEDMGIHLEIVVPELDVLGGKGFTIRPLVALAQIDGQFGVVLVPLPAPGDVRDDRLQVVGIAHEVDMAGRQEVRRAGLGGVGQCAEGAAILADRIIGRDDQRLGRQAFSERRQGGIALDLGVELGDVGIFAKAHLAVGRLLEFRELVLLREGAGRHPLHVGHGNGGTSGESRRRQRKHGYAG